jgi:hypothetical protein
MKLTSMKCKVVLLALGAALVCMVAGCSNAIGNAMEPGGAKVKPEAPPEEPPIVEEDGPYIVTFDSQGGPAVAAQTVEADSTATAPADPVSTVRFTIAEGLYTADSSAVYDIFGGWYKEPECATPWDFVTDTISGDTTLYALWTPSVQSPIDVSGQSGNNIVEQAVAYILANIPDPYTLVLDSDVTGMAPKVLNRAGISLTIATRGDTVRTISLGSTGTLFTINNNVTLKLEGHITLQGMAGNSLNPLVFANSGSTLLMSGHATITGNQITLLTSLRGSGLMIASNAVVEMSDYATISGNEVSGTHSMYAARGGGVGIEDGGLLKMSGHAAIKNNTVANVDAGGASGGGVFINGGTLIMRDQAAVSDNTVNAGTGTGTGGGVNLAYASSTFTMSGQSVVNGNQIVSGSAGKKGGGVYVNASFNLNTSDGLGSITGNSTTGGFGDKVYLINTGAFTINGNAASGQSNTDGSNPYWD